MKYDTWHVYTHCRHCYYLALIFGNWFYGIQILPDFADIISTFNLLAISAIKFEILKYPKAITHWLTVPSLNFIHNLPFSPNKGNFKMITSEAKQLKIQEIEGNNLYTHKKKTDKVLRLIFYPF